MTLKEICTRKRDIYIGSRIRSRIRSRLRSRIRSRLRRAKLRRAKLAKFANDGKENGVTGDEDCLPQTLTTCHGK